MAAPFSYVYGTFVDSQGDARASVDVMFEPLSTPFAAGDEIITSPLLYVTLDSNGKFGAEPPETSGRFKMVQGTYRVIVSDVDAFTISVPGDETDHNIDDLGSEMGAPGEELPKPITAADLLLSLSGSTSITHTRFGDPFATKTRFAFFGESLDLDVGDKLIDIVNALFPSDIFVLGNMNEDGASGTIDANIGQHFHDYIYPYSGSYGSGSADSVNHFWYALGSEDWEPGNVTAVTDYFTFPNNERYYKKVIGQVAFFIIDSNDSETDGNTYDSTQGAWLQTELAAATERWKVVVFRDSPVASKTGYSFSDMDWPFASWGANAVIAAGCSFYERITLTGDIPLFVVGLASDSLDTFGTPISGSEYRYNSKRGVLGMDVNEYALIFRVYTVEGDVLDTTTVTHSASGNVKSSVILDGGGGLIVNATGLGVQFGTADYQVHGGTSRHIDSVIGRFLRVDSVPSSAQVRESGWMKDCVFLVGDDPPDAYYWNKALGEVCLLFSNDGPTSYYSGARSKLDPPSFTPTGGQAHGVLIDHTDSSVTIYVSIDGGNFAAMTSWPTDKVLLLGYDGNRHWIAAYASEPTTYEDSDIVTVQIS